MRDRAHREGDLAAGEAGVVGLKERRKIKETRYLQPLERQALARVKGGAPAHTAVGRSGGKGSKAAKAAASRLANQERATRVGVAERQSQVTFCPVPRIWWTSLVSIRHFHHNANKG